MQDTTVSVLDYAGDQTNRTNVGTLNITDDYTVQGQTYNFTFDTVCGSVVELGVKHGAGRGYTHQASVWLR